jgi:PPOX class probable F420-dependent enzyme
MATFSMTREEREAFLEGLHVGIVTVADGDRGPIAAPVWYGYDKGGDVWFATARGSLKARLIEASGRAGFCIQTETPPYKYVSIEGPATLDACDYERHLAAVAQRYLGEAGGEAYLRSQGGPERAGDNVVVRIRPETWRTVDYGKAR